MKDSSDLTNNETYTPYFLILNRKRMKLIEVKKKIGKAYSIVHKQMNNLYENGYLRYFKEGYEINYNKLILDDFLYYIYQKGEPSHRNLLIEGMQEHSKNIENNKLLHELIKTSLDYVSNDASKEYLVEYLGKDIDKFTIQDLFYSIVMIFLSNNFIEGIINSDTRLKKLSKIKFEEFKKHYSKSPDTYNHLSQLIFLEGHIKNLWLDYDENLENEIKSKLSDILSKDIE